MKKRLIKRQKKIILVCCLVFLLLTITIFSFWVYNKPSSQKGSMPSSQTTLEEKKEQAIKFTESLLTQKNVSDEKLLQKLKNEKKVENNETDWRNYINYLVNSDDIITCENDLANIVNNLAGPNQPGPSGPNQPGPSGPNQPGPSGPNQPGPSGPNQPGPSGPNQPGPSGWERKWLDDKEIDDTCTQMIGENPDIVFVPALQTQLIIKGMTYDSSLEQRLKNSKLVLIPVNDGVASGVPNAGTHWTLWAYNTEKNQLYYYNSLSQPLSEIAEGVARSIILLINLGSVDNFNITDLTNSSPKQNDGWNCGVFVIANVRTLVEKFKQNCSLDNSNFWEIKEEDYKFSILDERKKALGIS